MSFDDDAVGIVSRRCPACETLVQVRFDGSGDLPSLTGSDRVEPMEEASLSQGDLMRAIQEQ